MKDLGLVLLVAVAGLAIVAASIFVAGDRSVLVAPPDAVAETFVRELAMARYDLARHQLAEDVERRTSGSDLRASFEPVRERTGKPDLVETETSSANSSHARVLARLEGRRGTASMYVDLVREHGVWKVATWPLDIVAR